MKYYIPIALILMCTPTALQAQQAVTYEEHELTTVANLWLSTANAAGVPISDFKNHGVSTMGYGTQGGNYHRAQEGNRLNRFDFFSERYDRIGKHWLAWGSFRFNMDAEKSRAWSDVIDTYNSSPYLFGSQVKAAYETQTFDLQVKTGRNLSDQWAVGIAANYKVADVSRQRDPRTRSYLADYSGRPGVIFSPNAHHRLGLTAAVRYRKEKMPSITTVQDDPNIVYYTMTGMENANATVAGFKAFQRQFVSNYWGGELQYNYHNSNFALLLNLGVMEESQEILESIRQSPGSYRASHLSGDLQATYQSERWLTALTWKNSYKKGAADEHLQELITTRDPETGITSQQWNTLYTYRNRYESTRYQSELSANIRNRQRGSTDYCWTAGLKASIWGEEKAYRLPVSTSKVHKAMVGGEGSYRVFRHKEHNVRIHARLHYELPIENELKLQERSLQVPDLTAGSYHKGTYAYATQVLLPDDAFYRAKSLGYAMEAQYNFPLQFKKLKMHSFVKAAYQAVSSNTHGSWKGASLTIGILP